METAFLGENSVTYEDIFQTPIRQTRKREAPAASLDQVQESLMKTSERLEKLSESIVFQTQVKAQVTNYFKVRGRELNTIMELPENERTREKWVGLNDLDKKMREAMKLWI